MEFTEDVKVDSEQDQPKENAMVSGDGILEDDKAIPRFADEHTQDENVDKALETEKEEGKARQACKLVERPRDLMKKSKEGSKRSSKTKVTIPQPFSLATERRMSRERRVSVDLSSSTEKTVPRERRGTVEFGSMQPKLSKSISLNKETAERKCQNHACATMARSLTSKVPGHPRDEKKSENGVKSPRKMISIKEEKNNLTVAIKQHGQKGETATASKLGKTSAFKALPLPSFYQKSDVTPKPVQNKVPSSCRKSPPPGQRSKSLNPAVNGLRKTSMSSNAKQTINKLLKSTRKALMNPSKDAAKSVLATA